MIEYAWDIPIPGTKWVRTWRLGEWLTAPVSPLTATLIIPALAQAREQGGTKHLGWKLPKGWNLPEPWFCIVNGYFFARADFKFASFIRFLLFDVPRLERAVARWRRVDLPNYLERLNRLKEFPLASASVPQLLSHIQDLCEDAAAWWHLIALEGGGAGFMERLFLSACRRYRLEDKISNALLGGIKSPVMDSEVSLYTLADRIRQDPELTRVFAQKKPEEICSCLRSTPAAGALLSNLETYLQEYGHQTASLDLLFPTPQEDPDQIMLLLQKMVSGELPNPALRQSLTELKREEALRFLAESRLLFPWRRRLLTGLLHRCRALALRREETVFCFQLGWPLLRRAVLELGDRLVAQGVLARREDIFFLTWEEVRETSAGLEKGAGNDFGELTASVRRRKALWEEQSTVRPPDRIPDSSDPVWEKHRGPAFWGEVKCIQEGNRTQLTGQAASPGQIRGSARIIRSLSDFSRFRKGDILVTETASPIWSPLLALAGGMVTESGGITSHVCTVAREYGIPAVIATGSATRVITDDQVIEVDGDKGVVLINARP